MYEHRYKYGKQKEIIPTVDFQQRIRKAAKHTSLEKLAYNVLLWHSGVRKSELYERPLSDIATTDQYVILDFHKRKKGGDEVEPLEIPRAFYGIEEYVIPYLQEAIKKHKCNKRIYYQKDKKRCSKLVTDKWLFPNIESVGAWRTVKAVLGKEYYPHYMRLRKLSRVAKTAKNIQEMIDAVHRVSGLKSISSMAAYFGTSEQVHKRAMHESE